MRTVFLQNKSRNEVKIVGRIIGKLKGRVKASFMVATSLPSLVRVGYCSHNSKSVWNLNRISTIAKWVYHMFPFLQPRLTSSVCLLLKGMIMSEQLWRLVWSKGSWPSRTFFWSAKFLSWYAPRIYLIEPTWVNWLHFSLSVLNLNLQM